MVYIQSWQEFQDAAELLYSKAQNDTRYCVKWNAAEGKLVLKITDNTTCIKFKTHSSIFLNRFESLNLSLMQKMQNHRVVDEPSTATPTSAAVVADLSSPSSAIPAPGTPASAGVKKKKPKKKK